MSTISETGYVKQPGNICVMLLRHMAVIPGIWASRSGLLPIVLAPLMLNIRHLERNNSSSQCGCYVGLVHRAEQIVY